MRPLRVFLCHASQDKPAVWRLHRYLKQHGIKPWLDQEDLLPGEDWEVEISKAIYTSDVILVCLSKNSVNKEGMVQKEITFALDKAMEKPEGTIFIIPVKLEECDIPKRLNRYQWVDLSRADGRRRLLMGLNKRVNDLGEEVQQITLDDTRQRTPIPKTPKPEIKKPEEQIISVPIKEEVEESKKEQSLVGGSSSEVYRDPNKDRQIQKKPFTKVLDPSSLSPKGTSYQQGGEQGEPLSSSKREGKSKPKFKTVFVSVAAIFLFVMIFYGLGMNYLIQNFPLVTITSTFSKSTSTADPPTSTITPFSSTSQPTKTSIQTPALGIGSTMISEKDGMVLVYIPAGEFTMGSDSYPEERPIHQVVLDAFWIDQTEVTNKMYAKCVDDGKCNPPNDTKSYTHPNYYGNSEFDNYPVIYVSWNDALAYCSWADRRLPTEAEWEKTARGTSENIYPWGNMFDGTIVNFCDTNCSFDYANKSFNDGYADVSPVGNYPSGKSIYGTLDMAGNVWEWVNDWYDVYPDGDASASSFFGQKYRVLRGGSWNYDNYRVRSVYRIWYDPTDTSNFIGFRCALSP